MARLILLDRDGVINFDSPNYIKSPSEWQAIPGSLQGIAALKRAGRAIAVCTNQAGVGRGLFSLGELTQIHARFEAELAKLGARVDALRFCPHRPDAGCRCRKPQPGMLLDAMAELGFAGAETCFVGDSLKDLQAAAAAGCDAVLVRTGNGARLAAQNAVPGVRVFDDLAAFVRAELGVPG